MIIYLFFVLFINQLRREANLVEIGYGNLTLIGMAVDINNYKISGVLLATLK